MGLIYTGVDADVVSYGNPQTAPTVFTWAAWVYPNSLATTNLRLAAKGGTTGYVTWEFPDVGVATRMRIVINYSIADATARSVDSTITANEWQFIVATFDGTIAPKLYRGTRTTSVAEVSYFSSAAPSGTRGTENDSTLYIGNQTAPSRSFPGTIAWFAWYNSVLTLQQLISLQFNPRVLAGTLLFVHQGFNGTSTQADWSGNLNNGTVTGAVVDAHVPVRIAA